MLQQCQCPLMDRINMLNANNHRKLKFKIFIRWFCFDTLCAKPLDFFQVSIVLSHTKLSTKVYQNAICFSLPEQNFSDMNSLCSGIIRVIKHLFLSSPQELLDRKEQKSWLVQFLQKNASRNFLIEYAKKILSKNKVPDQSIPNIAQLDWKNAAMEQPHNLSTSVCVNKKKF